MTFHFQAQAVQLTTSQGQQIISWQESGREFSYVWHSENQTSAPKKICLADDRISADSAYKLMCEGCAFLWQGDYHQARQLLMALSRRIDKKKQNRKPTESVTTSFHKHRQDQAQKARILGMLLIPFAAGFIIPLRRAPQVSEICQQVFSADYSSPAQAQLANTNFTLSLRELLGLIGAYEWRKNGVMITALNGKIHPYYGVFSPVRGEYLELIQNAQFASTASQITAFDIGTGTGVISAILAKRGVTKIIATDQDPRALACAQFNLQQLGYQNHVKLLKQDLFPEGHADLIVCNPPWLPAKPNAAIEYALYDADSQMLKRFLLGLKNHLNAEGEAWLIMSDFAEHLGLRQFGELERWIKEAELRVKNRLDARPQHKKTQDQQDPLHLARSKEKTSLWVLSLA